LFASASRANKRCYQQIRVVRRGAKRLGEQHGYWFAEAFGNLHTEFTSLMQSETKKKR
jgi:hypothetical protein